MLEGIGMDRIDSVPTASEAYGEAWTVLKKWFLPLLLLALVWSVVASPAAIARHGGASLFSAIYFTLVVAPVTFGSLAAQLGAVRGRAPEVGQLFVPFREYWGQVILAHVLWCALVTMGFALLVIPGFIVATRLSFVGFLVVDRRLDAIEAFSERWRLTRGYAGTIFLVFVLGIPVALVGSLLGGVGIVPAVVWTHLAFATVYDEIMATEPRSG